MTSQHTWKAIEKAARKGAAAGEALFVASHLDLWSLSKRELLEAALHLAAVNTDSYDAAMADGASGAARRLREEISILRGNGLI